MQSLLTNALLECIIGLTKRTNIYSDWNPYLFSIIIRLFESIKRFLEKRRDFFENAECFCKTARDHPDRLQGTAVCRLLRGSGGVPDRLPGRGGTKMHHLLPERSSGA